MFPSAIAFAGLSGTIFSNVSTKDVSVFAPSYLSPSVLKLPPDPGFIISANVTAIEMATAVVTRKNEIDFKPILPSCFGSPRPAAPSTIEINTTGTTSILMSRINN